MLTAVAVAEVIAVGANPHSPLHQLVKNELISVVAWTEMSDVQRHFQQQFLSCQQSYNNFFYSEPYMNVKLLVVFQVVLSLHDS